MAKKDSLEDIIGELCAALKESYIGTVSHSYEIMKERIKNNELRERWYFTADFPMYTVENDKVILYFAKREHNLIFRHIDDAVKQIKETRDYTPSLDEMNEIKESVKIGETIKIDLSELNLQKHTDDELCYFEISTASKSENESNNYDSLNKTQRKFAEMVYGKGEDFKEVMKMLKDNKMEKTRIYVLNPEYVKKKAKNGNAISRASWVNRFLMNSNFDAGVHNVGSAGGCIRAVLDAKPKGVTQDDINSAYSILITNPDKIDDNKYAGLSGLVTNYITGRQKLTKE